MHAGVPLIVNELDKRAAMRMGHYKRNNRSTVAHCSAAFCISAASSLFIIPNFFALITLSPCRRNTPYISSRISNLSAAARNFMNIACYSVNSRWRNLSLSFSLYLVVTSCKYKSTYISCSRSRAKHFFMSIDKWIGIRMPIYTRGNECCSRVGKRNLDSS